MTIKGQTLLPILTVAREVIALAADGEEQSQRLKNSHYILTLIWAG
jgi:hypothetical protein